ncbi:hypothetical protein [Puerhibacterium sp. TATVAM-FAB25]|uniref:hypothetical protein n=1 Tax=Puerhibacterium sp. TATVAM-FAB25 TaxID=3093699 RepID=UPI00397CB7F6
MQRGTEPGVLRDGADVLDGEQAALRAEALDALALAESLAEDGSDVLGPAADRETAGSRELAADVAAVLDGTPRLVAAGLHGAAVEALSRPLAVLMLAVRETAAARGAGPGADPGADPDADPGIEA